jgi:hypothetical protein
VIGGEDAEPIGGANEERRDAVLVGGEQPAAEAAAHEAVLVMDE